MRRPDVFVRTGGQLRSAGYEVEARALAVPERLSWQGVHQRYEATLAVAGGRRGSWGVKGRLGAEGKRIRPDASRVDGGRTWAVAGLSR